MLLAARSAFLAQKKKLPFDSAVEYLESTGTQWIDTGVVPDSLTECVADIMYLASTTQQFGSGRSSSSAWAILFGFYSNDSSFWPGVSQPTIKLNRGINRRFSCGFSIPKLSYSVDGIFTKNNNISQPSGTVQTFGLFARKNASESVSAYCKMRLYSLTFYTSTTQLNLIPVRKDRVGYLYDKVSKQLFGNKGTGNFLYGKDVKVEL